MKRTVLIFLALTRLCVDALAPKPMVVRPKEIDDVLVNPGMGFTTFQRLTETS